MSLYQDWQELIDNQTEDTFEVFWKEYAETETKLYSHILENHTEHLSGTVAELVEKFECNKTIFVGFLDGINSSLNKEMDCLSLEIFKSGFSRNFWLFERFLPFQAK